MYHFGQVCNISDAQFLHVVETILVYWVVHGVVGRLNEITHVKHLAQCWVDGKHLIFSIIDVLFIVIIILVIYQFGS